jgi:hypothetical protein
MCNDATNGRAAVQVLDDIASLIADFHPTSTGK